MSRCFVVDADGLSYAADGYGEIVRVDVKPDEQARFEEAVDRLLRAKPPFGLLNSTAEVDPDSVDGERFGVDEFVNRVAKLTR